MSHRIGNALIITGWTLLAVAIVSTPAACVMGRY